MVQLLRAMILLVGLVMTVLGCLLLSFGFGVPLDELVVVLGQLELSAGNIPGGIIFSVFGVILIYIASRHLKKTVQEKTVNEVGPQGIRRQEHEVNSH